MRDSKPKPPRLIVQPPELDFGTVRPGARSERRLRIVHSERSKVAGQLYLGEARTGLGLSTTHFDSTPTTLIVTLDATGYAGSARRETGIRIQSDECETHVRVRFRVRGFPRTLKRGLQATAVLLLGMILWWVGGQRVAELAWSTAGMPRLIAMLPWLAERPPSAPRLSQVEVAPGLGSDAGQPPAQPKRRESGVSQVTIGQKAPKQGPDVVERVRQLRNQGRLNEALRYAEQGLVDEPVSPELKTIRAELLGQVHEASLSSSEREHTQRALTLLGFDTKGVDGDFGPNTRRAIRQFQRSQRAPETGWLTKDQRSTLMTEAKPLLSRLEDGRQRQQPPPRGTAPSEPSSRAALPAGQVECVGPRGTFLVDAASCRRAGGQPSR